MQILVEPEAVFTERHAKVPEDALQFTRADAHIYAILRAGPMRLTTLLNITGQLMPVRSKRERLALKREILRRLGVLIREGQLQRIRRKFVALPTYGLWNRKHLLSPAVWQGSTIRQSCGVNQAST